MLNPTFSAMGAVVVLAAFLVIAGPASGAPPDARFRVIYARVVDSSTGPHLVVRVKAPARTRTVRVRVAFLNSRRLVLRIAIRTVRTNRRVVVPGLKFPARATSVRVRIVGHVG
jgi:stringent starvation protein B